ncbi:UBC-like protein [Hygrophoropsis aurantiaca]|uniref:UBC-like protein n=1 Tax=Hygrophoropsis aurantiaca TaxID=72124 RepID=A0ACB8AMS5_9AGAM|nr:UBC-like protein [Hygrophoropsis aurantiaca]
MLSALVPSQTIDFSRSKGNSGKGILPASESANTIAENTINPVTRAAISLEYASLRHHRHCPTGMYVIPSSATILVWEVAFFVHQGYYADSILKFELTFPNNYPEKPPAVRFLIDIFHPLIAPTTGAFTLAPRFRPWRPKEHHIFDVLHWIKASFKKSVLDKLNDFDCLNKEAFKSVPYRDNTSSFAALATQSSKLSQSPSALYDSTGPRKGSSALRFSKLKPEHAVATREKLGLQLWSDPAEIK